MANWMRTSDAANMERFAKNIANVKLAGSEHMFWRGVLLFWAYGMDSISVWLLSLFALKGNSMKW
jgi:hypothetical protein